MKRCLAFSIISIAIQGLLLTGCAGIRGNPQQSSLPQVGDKGYPPHAEASRQDVLGTGKRIVLGFYIDAGKGPKESLLKNIHLINEAAFFWYSFDGTGKVKRSGRVDLGLKDRAQKGGAKAYALVDNMNGKQFDPRLAHQVLANKTVRGQFVNNLVALATHEDWDGISIDIEKTPAADRSSYSAFVSDLHGALKAKGKILNVSIPAKYHDDLNDLWSGAYDYAAIGKAADEVVLMTYEEHGVGTTQGPIASQGWVNRVINYAKGKIPKAKIVMGIPVYAYDWASDRPTQPISMALSQAADLARKQAVNILYDETEQAPHYAYTAAGVRHEVYFENKRSLNYKLNIAEKNQLRGIAIWRLGLEEPTLWTDVLKDFGSSQGQEK